MVESFDFNYVFDNFNKFDKEIRKTIKRHFLTLGKESFLLGLILISTILYFTFIFKIIPIWVVPFFATFGLILSIMQILRQTHALAIAGFILNLFALLISMFYLII
ncbi:MAG: hypothetical protein QXW97_02055 [Candidatus Pacearchaeota archaeon]